VIQPGDDLVEAAVELPAPATLVDVMSGERLSGDMLIHVTMGPRSCRIFEIERIADGMEQARRRRSWAP
jgi:hypothetical protein